MRTIGPGNWFDHSTLGRVTIRKIHPFGTLDVEATDGNWYRISGLSFNSATPAMSVLQAGPL